MKTIEEKLSDYLDSKSGDSLGSPINALSVGFKDGAGWMQEEFQSKIDKLTSSLKQVTEELIGFISYELGKNLEEWMNDKDIGWYECIFKAEELLNEHDIKINWEDRVS